MRRAALAFRFFVASTRALRRARLSGGGHGGKGERSPNKEHGRLTSRERERSTHARNAPLLSRLSLSARTQARARAHGRPYRCPLSGAAESRSPRESANDNNVGSSAARNRFVSHTELDTADGLMLLHRRFVEFNLFKFSVK